MKRRIILSIIIVFIVIVVILQFRPVVSNPPVTSDLGTVPDEIKDVLKNSCYDCHSNETDISWFNKLPFVASIVNKDVEKARSKFNFSEWDKYSDKEKKTILFNALTKIKKEEMPPARYLWLHKNAVLNKEDISLLESYITQMDTIAKTTTDEERISFEKEYKKWNENKHLPKKPADAPNGIAFPHDYRSWQVISSSYRVDNNTLRVILGNDIAIQAIHKNEINPWPDGAILGKVIWNQRVDENWEAAIIPSTFVHAEFMFKDSKKYAGTNGWGWARWLGTELKPFGKDQTFVQSCIECHKPVKNRDYVFSTPSIFP
ncbi:cytochrome P460 family protein [Abyssalbus ytuae]|uniref:Heme-binding domain-containing protein n=1 Tax=Abyssalbus ytuae TaxID=2926907 RepID=A0A9E6ZLR1_9FLAO|nr:cytochrome P460 family protein [Abyssalbus ytuae]UOB18119.1 heme-binding domain-containing protein [Abyssalbus ytuae]